MQPYFFPYLGYWQLVNAVDEFVILDDVNYIMRGYINKNSILINGMPHKFSISIDKPSQNKLINQTKLAFPIDEREKLLKTIEMAYHKAPYYSQAFRLIEESVMFNDKDLVSFLKNSLCLTADYLGLSTRIIVSSELEKDNTKKAQERIIEINKCLGADTYINAIGGRELYDKEEFMKNNINLFFIEMGAIEYVQFKNKFVPNLSMIDVLMFNGKSEIQSLLNNYTLI